MSAKVRFETNDSAIEKNLTDRGIVDEYLLAECIVQNIAAFAAQLQASGSYINFVKVFEDKFKSKFGQTLPCGIVELK